MARLFNHRYQPRYQLNERAGHSSVSVSLDDTVFVWAGRQDGRLPEVHDSEEKRRITSSIQYLSLSTGQWVNRDTTGSPPLGVRGYSCSATNNHLYYFGGYCGHDVCFHNSITELDTVTFQWRVIEATSATRPVMMRCHGGMLTFKHNGMHLLLIIGGIGSKPTLQAPHTEYTKLPDGRWRTNEHSIYNLSSRKWSNPLIVGQCPPHIHGFIIEKINNTKAILFGGSESDDTVGAVFVSNHIYQLEISVGTVCWQRIKKPQAMSLWPEVRYIHAAAVIPGSSPMLLISGGRDNSDDIIDDFWILDITEYSWIKLDVPHCISKRWGHSLSVFNMSPHCIWVITIGGLDDSKKCVKFPNTVMLTELVTSGKGNWIVSATLNSHDLTTEEYRTMYHHQLKLVRKQWLGESQQLNNCKVELQQKEVELQQQKNQREQDAQFFHIRMEQKEKEEAVKEQEMLRYRYQLQEKERELHESQEANRVYQQQVVKNDHWVICKDEVILTHEELGRGSYASVKVGIFRGLRVAVKSLHTIIISEYNLALFSREMSIASQLRHPNLVQFIGATKVGNPLILTELMSTSLHKELQKNQLTKEQILSIAQDVALGLNYLHLFKPQPIIHRDVSSPNVLLKPCTRPAGYDAKLADYGTANLQEAATTVMPGNQAYAAPEAFNPELHSPAMDIYSYSILLMEMVLHQPPAMKREARGQQACQVSWSAMKSVIQTGINTDPRARPSMALIIQKLKE